MRLALRYRLVGPQGQPPGGERVDRALWIAQDRLTGGTVVLKCARMGTAAADELVAEGGRLASLAHPGLVQLADRFVDVEGLGALSGVAVVGFASRWVDGTPFDEAVRGLPVDRAMALFSKLLDVVDYLHRRGLLHLDLKPDNALVVDDEVVLLDLGSARSLDAGPGEAGGTLGHAAPEVLLGQAASVAADIYSLGGMLYALLTGQPAFVGLEGIELRRATLAGEVVPVRARAPRASRPLARLAEAMLARHASDRPASVAAVQQALRAAGGVVSRRPGAPPMVGRADALARLEALVQVPGGGVICVTGPPGSGRTRLVHALLSSPERLGGRQVLDLSGVEDVIRGLDGLALITGQGVPDPESGAAWSRAMGALLRDWPLGPMVLFPGERARMSPDARRTIEALAPDFVQGGFQLVWVCETGSAAVQRTVAVSPLDLDQTAQLAANYGIFVSVRVEELHRRTGGLAAKLVELLSVRSADAQVSPSPERDLLALLPSGIPRSFTRALPQQQQAMVQRLVDDGTAQWEADDRLYGAAEAPDTPVDNAELSVVLVGTLKRLGEAGAVDVWMTQAAVALDESGLAQEWFARMTSPDVRRDAGWRPLVEALAGQGLPAARQELARIREESGDLHAAIGLVRALGQRTESDTLRLLRCLRRTDQLDAAAAELGVHLSAGPTAQLWLEQARLHLRLKDLQQAISACERAEALSPEAVNEDALGLRISVAMARLSRGPPPADLGPLLEQVEACAERLPSRTLSTAGRILTRTGHLKRGERMLARAARAADDEGDSRAAAGIRLNRGNALQRLSRGRDARRCYRDALVIAERSAFGELLLRIRYSLADLELRSGRLPAAESQIVAFELEAQTSPAPELRARAQELRARLLLAQERPADALAVLDSMDGDALDVHARAGRDIGRATALLELHQPERVLPVLEQTPPSRVPTVNALIETLRGRAHIAIGRQLLSSARSQVPEDPDLLVRAETGAVLLAAAGEDLDAATFGQRRADLDTAARLLRGTAAAQAATLRDRLLDGPGANLEGVVALTEAMNSPREFPGALARLVSEALGAYRVLIMLRIPGLGRQVTYKELSGTEAAGIGTEVLRHIRKADDYWLAHNAFADPHLRRTSQTVRTFELKSLLAVAIPGGDDAIGALYVDDLYRANRFDDADVAMLRRLATAVGRMLELLGRTADSRGLAGPVDVMGVLLQDRRHVQDMEYAVQMLVKDAQNNLLITGPTGAGKSVLAGRIAQDVLGLDGVETVVLRRGDPQMLVTQLTGARRGEFTGALDREGAIQRCLRTNRALFLDEVQNLDESSQPILLPLLEVRDRHFGGLTGSSVAIEGQLHIILGTNVDVSHGRWAAHFREDLWYRMSSTHIHLPPLAERGAEAIYRYLSRMLSDVGAPPPEEVFHTDALHRTTTWHWPGNLRQLQVFADRAARVFRSSGDQITVQNLARLGMGDSGTGDAVAEAEPTLEGAMIEHVLKVLEAVGWVQSRAADELRMTPSRLNKLLKRHELLDEVKRRRRDHRG